METQKRPSNNYILIISNSRHKIVSRCIKSVFDLENSEMWKKIHIHQIGHALTTKQFYKFQKNFDINILSEPKYSTNLSNINYNRLLGYRIAFDLLGADNVFGIEEDTVIAKDALVFTDFILNKYSKDSRFRGINFGSGEIDVSEYKNSYSLLRFGIQGQASLLTRNTWAKMPMSKLLNYESGEGWDSPIEFILKTGFMVTPNSSRILDYGWDSGTHAPKNKKDYYYMNMNKSFFKSRSRTNNYYQHNQIKHNSRLDSIEYLAKDNWIFDLRSRLNIYYFTKMLKKFMTSKWKSRLGVKN